MQLAIVTVRDITERYCEEINSRFLAEAARTLRSSLDHETSLSNVADLAATLLADCLYRNAQQEIAQRQHAEGQLHQLNETLEQRICERTAEAEKRAEQLQLMAKQLTEAERDLQQILMAAKMRLKPLRKADAQTTGHHGRDHTSDPRGGGHPPDGLGGVRRSDCRAIHPG